MMTKRLQFPATFKASESGVIEGYASVFGNVDSYGDIVAPGAFKRTLAEAKAAGRLFPMLWQHNPDEPIGVWTDLVEDEHGLRSIGQLAIDTQRGKEALALVRMKAVGGESIGYSTKNASYDKSTGINTLLDLNLWEVSLVTFPANSEARITGVKAVEAIQTIRDAEDTLREAGFSRDAARAFIARIKAINQREADEAEVVQSLKRLTNLITSK